MKQLLVLVFGLSAALAAGTGAPAHAAGATAAGDAPASEEALLPRIADVLGAERAGKAPRPEKPLTGATARHLRQTLTAWRERLLASATAAASPSGATASGPARAIAGAAPAALPDAALRCALGVLHAHAGELARAQLHLAACALIAEAAPLRQRGDQAQAAVSRALRASSLSPLDLATAAPGWVATVEGYAEGACLTPCTLWLPAGKHRLRLAPTAAALASGRGAITRQFVAERGNRGAIFVEAPPPPPGAAGTGFVDLAEEVALEAPQTTRPAPEKHRSIMPDRYRRGLSPSTGAPSPGATSAAPARAD
jgi:hypothetical protein